MRMLLFLGGDPERNGRKALVFFLIGLTFVALYFLIAARLKRVAIGKKRIIVMDNNKSEHYEWPEVKSIKMVPYFNLCKLKLKGRRTAFTSCRTKPSNQSLVCFPLSLNW
ncbi:MAG: hypothetical protein WDN75_16410 [Bacteroidota bacterium]